MSAPIEYWPWARTTSAMSGHPRERLLAAGLQLPGDLVEGLGDGGALGQHHVQVAEPAEAAPASSAAAGHLVRGLRELDERRALLRVEHRLGAAGGVGVRP